MKHQSNLASLVQSSQRIHVLRILDTQSRPIEETLFLGLAVYRSQVACRSIGRPESTQLVSPACMS